MRWAGHLVRMNGGKLAKRAQVEKNIKDAGKLEGHRKDRRTA